MFIPLLDSKKVISMAKIKLSIDFRPRRSVEEVVDERKRVPILLREEIEPVIVHTESKGSVLLPSEENGCSVGGTGWIDEVVLEVSVQKLAESFELELR
jgi:hypothetical protein